MFIGQSEIMKYHMPSNASVVPVVAIHECNDAQSRALDPYDGIDPVHREGRKHILNPDAFGYQCRRRFHQRVVIIIHNMEYLIHGCKGQWFACLFLEILTARLQDGLQLVQGQDREKPCKAKEEGEENSQGSNEDTHVHISSGGILPSSMGHSPGVSTSQ